MAGEPSNPTEVYLQAIRPHASPGTYQSHQNCLQHLNNWILQNNDTTSTISHRTVIKFLEDQYTDSTLSEDTLKGYVGTLVNFITYHKGAPPQFALDLIRLKLDEFETSDVPATVSTAIRDLLFYLSSQKYGERTHAYVEVLLAIDGPAVNARRINVYDVNIDEQIAYVPVSDRWLVGRTGIVDTCPWPLSDEASQVLKTYINSHRRSSDSRALFTSTQGRASQSILRRNLQAAGETALEFHNHTDDDIGSGLEELVAEYDYPPSPADIVSVDRSNIR